MITTPDDGGPDVTKSIAKGATVTLDGKAAKLTDLQAGDAVELSGDPATLVSATR